ncbi:hypothetical protein [Saccharothrix texasensis]|uniref:DNA-binding protein n=1 Tax=Saccharothrix texasensis TaxID=103734 RepID=A0A3N1GX71_9PSEU|nr:hypothetical protein [Saccharothrix texasensis]ROP34850.1 hypothetical protein EDD40_0054 [Saccharothrix texasensis]
MSELSPKTLISAGAVLPGAGDVGEDRDTVTARHYAHEGLDGRVVVRLVPAVLGRAEDLTCEYLGFDAPVRVADVGTGKRSALGFPAWALVHDPANGHHALNLVKDVERLARTAKSRAGAAKDGFTALGAMLGRSAPHFLPTFYEQAGRIFLQHGNTSYAASMFGKAREAEEVHDLAVDPERTREVFLEFAFAGALTAKALSAHAKGLARKHDPDAAYELFFTLCVERTRGGLPPYTGMPEDLRRLAKAAKRDLGTEDQRLLRAILDSSAISRAGGAFWKSYRASLVALAKGDAEVRGRLLAFVPDSESVLDLWLDILTACGATRALIGPDEVEANPAEWLSSVLAVRSSGWRGTARSVRLLELVEAMAGRLVADGVPVRALRYYRQGDLDVLDLLVSHDVPIARGRRDDQQLDVAGWLADDDPGRRDLAALAASERFGAALGAGFIVHARSQTRPTAVAPDVLSAAMAVPGLRSALGAWIAARVGHDTAVGLPDLSDHLGELSVVRLPEAYVDVPEAAESLSRTDVAAALHRTLRAGLLDELGWPALEEAVARLASVGTPKDDGVVVCGEGWPALVLRRGETFVVVGPDGVLAEHVSRIPADARHRWGFAPTGSWFDGVLLVRWHGPDGELAYWSDAPDHVFAPTEGSRSYSRHELARASIALPGGGRFTGERAVHPGDTVMPAPADAHGDGTTLWTGAFHDHAWRWFEVDPATGRRGRASLPRFIEDFAADGASLELAQCDLRPAVPATQASPLGAADGLHGWRVRREADGSCVGEGVDGRRVRLPGAFHTPTGVLRLPGGAELTLASSNRTMVVLDAEGVRLAAVSATAQHPPYATGTPFVPPLEWWHLLRPRDEAGSAALRGVTREAVNRMLAAARAEGPDKRTIRERLTALVKGERGGLAGVVAAALPGLTHPALISGVVDVVRRAAELERSYRGYGEVAEAARAVDPVLAPTGPDVTEDEVNAALNWFGGYRSYNSRGLVPTGLPALITALGEAVARTEARDLPLSNAPRWFDALPHLAALAHRAASPLTPDDQRAALALVLRSVADGGLADGAGHWRTVGVVVHKGEASPKDRVVPVRDGFIALFETQWRNDPGSRFDGLQFSRTPGAFDLPKGWHVESAQEVRHPFGPERVARFLDALAERGPAPWFPEAVPALVELTGLGSAEATLLLAGLPGVSRWDANFLATADRHLLGLSSGAAKAAKERFRGLADSFRLELVAAAVPADPTDLWTSGPDVAAVAEVWTAAHGRRSPVPDDVLVDAVKLLNLRNAGEYVAGLVNPDLTPWLVVDADLTFTGSGLEARHPDGFDRAALWAVPEALGWLAHRLPAGSPLRARLPEALALARQRVAHPRFALDLGRWVELERVCALLGVDLLTEDGVHEYHDWLELARAGDVYCRLVVRPGLVEPADRELFVALTALAGGQDVQRMLDRLADDRLTALCAVPAPEGVDPAAYHQDPMVSVPALVAEVAARFGLTEDAAALYLQLLALPDPTDANVARWTGWKPARLRQARTALAATDLVLTAKRARAGRSLFLPGGWLALSAPHLPLEGWKAPMFDYANGQPGAIVPREPVADLFARAWQRVLDGDAPAYEELRTGGRK